VSGGIIALTSALSVACAVLFGLAPMLEARSVELSTSFGGQSALPMRDGRAPRLVFGAASAARSRAPARRRGRVDTATFGFASAAAIGAALLIGFAPTIEMRRTALGDALRSGGAEERAGWAR